MTNVRDSNRNSWPPPPTLLPALIPALLPFISLSPSRLPLLKDPTDCRSVKRHLKTQSALRKQLIALHGRRSKAQQGSGCETRQGKIGGPPVSEEGAQHRGISSRLVRASDSSLPCLCQASSIGKCLELDGHPCSPDPVSLAMGLAVKKKNADAAICTGEMISRQSCLVYRFSREICLRTSV